MGADASPETLWYFAYGSNMSSAKFTGSRGVVPLDSARAFVPHWMMTMEIPGLPYSEPAFGSLKPRAATSAGDVGTPDVIGVAYLITAEQYRHVIASEGGGTAYSDVEIAAKGVSPWDQQKIRNGRPMRTLGSSTMTRAPPAAPSLRYMVRDPSTHIDRRLMRRVESAHRWGRRSSAAVCISSISGEHHSVQAFEVLVDESGRVALPRPVGSGDGVA
jgi:hypothetical protein